MYRATSLALFCLASVFVACSPRPTVVEVINEPVKEELYAVGGDSIDDVVTSIRSKMTAGFAGYAGVYVNYEFQPNSSIFGSCTVKHIKITTRSFVKVPEWKSSGSFEASMLPNWLRYIQALRLHEDGHIQLGLEAAKNFASKFEHPNKVKADNCSDLERLIRQIYDADIAKLQQDNRDYDKLTGHGKTQGTDFTWN
jgi:predicted secreted Zn-dependent protease